MAATGTAIWPGSTTLPGSSTIPGQGNFPFVRFLHSVDDVTDSSPSYTEYTSRMIDWSCSHGRSSERSDFDSGTATFRLRNRDRYFDPNTTAAIGPRNRVWLYEEFSGERQTLFKGYAQSYTQSWDETGILDAFVTIDCTDEMSLLNMRKLPLMDPPSAASYTDVVQFDNPSAYYRWEQYAPMRTLVSSYDIFLHRFDPWNLTGAKDDVFVKRVTITTTEIPGWVITSGSYTVANDSAVLGDLIGSSEDGLNGSLNFTGACVMTSTDGNAGDMLGSGTGGVVECWFKKASNPGGNTAFWAGPGAASFPGSRLWTFTLLTTGAVSFAYVDSAGATKTASGATALSSDTWYHLAGGIVGGTLKLFVNAVQDASTAITNVWASAIDDTIPMIVQRPGANINLDEMAIYPFPGLSTSRISAHYVAGTARGYAKELSNARVGNILDTIGPNHTPRSFRAGSQSIHGAFMSGQTAMDLIRSTMAVELADGAFFYSHPAEAFKLLENGHRSVSPWSTSQATYDYLAGAALQYVDVTLDYAEDFLINQWNVSRIGAGSVMQTAEDTTSQSKYDVVSQTIADIPVVDNTASSTIASSLLAKYKNPLQRVTAVEPHMGDPETARVTYDREVMDRITVKIRPIGGGSPISQDLFIQKISHSGSDQTSYPRCIFEVSPV